MLGEERRAHILARLAAAKQPLSASALATMCHVSRQVIVGDVALLRAAGQHVRATSRGYVLVHGEPDGTGFQGQVACQHPVAETEAELALIIALGGEVVDVAVDHPLYGELRGNLDLKTSTDVAKFVAVLGKKQVRLLSELTAGVHLHTLRTQDQETFKAIQTALSEAGFLYQD